MIIAVLFLALGSLIAFFAGIHVMSAFAPDYEGYEGFAYAAATTVFCFGASLLFALDSVATEIRKGR